MEKQNPNILELAKLILKNYGEIYFKEKHEDYLIRKRLL